MEAAFRGSLPKDCCGFLGAGHCLSPRGWGHRTSRGISAGRLPRGRRVVSHRWQTPITTRRRFGAGQTHPDVLLPGSPQHSCTERWPEVAVHRVAAAEPFTGASPRQCQEQQAGCDQLQVMPRARYPAPSAAVWMLWGTNANSGSSPRLLPLPPQCNPHTAVLPNSLTTVQTER